MAAARGAFTTDMTDADHAVLLARLLDRQAIADLVIRYTTAIDERDWALLRTCFTNDAIADYGDLGRYEGVDAIVPGCREPLSRLDASQHLLGNIVIEITGENTAVVTSKVQAQHFLVNAAGDPTATIGGTYVDDLSRQEDGWRIAKLSFRASWRTGNAAILAPTPKPDRFGRMV